MIPKVYKPNVYVAYLNHDCLAQILFPTDGECERIILMLMQLSETVLEAKREIEEQVIYSLRQRDIIFNKTRQQKIDEQLD